VSSTGRDPVSGWSAVSSANLTALEGDDSYLAASDFATAVGTGDVYQAYVVLNSNLTGNQVFWDGALLTAHNWFVSETGTVTDSQVGTITAASLPSCVGLSPNQSTEYSLTGKLELLGQPGEWFYQSSSHTLYFYSPNGTKPAAGSVEAKQRSVVIDLSGRSHISVVNLGIRGATAQASASSSGGLGHRSA
jgi:hypothetical protein